MRIIHFCNLVFSSSLHQPIHSLSPCESDLTGFLLTLCAKKILHTHLLIKHLANAQIEKT